MTLLQTLAFGLQATWLEHSALDSLEEIEQTQRKRLVELVRHAKQHSAYYGETLASIDPDSFELADLPTTNKQEMMANFERVLTVDDIKREDIERFFEDPDNLGKYFQDKYVLSHTSGSQGQPLLIVQTQEDMDLLFALQASRGNKEDMGIVEGVKRLLSPVRLAVVTLKRGFYPSASAFEFLPDGMRGFLDVRRLSLTDDDLIEQLAEFRPTHLSTYASILHEIARAIEQGKLDLKPELEQVVNFSERLTPKARKQYIDLLGAPILDDYGMGECLFLSNGCPKTGGMHVNADWVVLEVVDDENRPVPPGTKGCKVLITNLSNKVQPFIRYEVGDVVTMASEPCGCGSNMPLIASIEGRSADMFKIDGAGGERSLSPLLFQHVLERVLDAREYQIIQEEPNTFHIRLEPLPGSSLDAEQTHRALEEHLKESNVDEDLNLEIEIVDRIAGNEDKKFRRIVPLER
jgi:phenylacetate-CoA ligase